MTIGKPTRWPPASYPRLARPYGRRAPPPPPPQIPANREYSAVTPAGPFTVVLSGKSGGTGIGVIEIYDLK